MNFFVLLLVLSLATFLVYRYKERSLYVLFLAAYTQNFVVPFLYTHGYIGKDLARGLILLKDFLLLELFVWCLVLLFRRFGPPWPRPTKPLLFLTAYCTFRFLIGVIFLGESWHQGLYLVRSIWFPLEILIPVAVLTALKPQFGEHFLQNMTYILGGLAVVALLILFFAPRDFWLENANVAEVQDEVKWEGPNGEPDALDFGLGLNASGTLGITRSEDLGFALNFRAMGTFGEGLALAFSMAAPVLLVLFCLKRNIVSVLSLIVSGAALFFSFSRSAWIFCAFVAVYVLLRRRRYRPLMLAGCSMVGLLLLWPPLANFASDSVSELSLSRGNPETGHAQGILWFYARGFSELGNILGKGMAPEAQSIPESGYAYLLEHFGVLAYASFLWFCISLYRQLIVAGRGAPALSTLCRGLALGLLVIMHFSQYPFSLPTFMSLWYVVGLCLSNYLVPRKEFRREPVPQGGQAPTFQTL